MSNIGILGIDAGTQGLSVVFVDESLKVVATGDGAYEMVSGLPDGCYEQRPQDWESALQVAMADLQQKLGQLGVNEIDVQAVGISGQMHGEVLIDNGGNCIGNARLWCDSRNDDEGIELTKLLGVKMPKRITAARWLWTCRNDKEKAGNAKRMTTPAGWLAFRLTGEHLLGIGDASGMFPIDQQTLNFDQDLFAKFDSTYTDYPAKLNELLPQVKKAGEDGGTLNETGAGILGLPAGIPVAPAEGDQPAALAGSMIADPGLVSVSFGTSVCANSIGDRPFKGVSDAIDHFCAVDGRPINMVFLRNGTTFMNSVVEEFASKTNQEFGELMKLAVEAPADCGGVLALPFMDDEPGLGILDSGNSGLFGTAQDNPPGPGNAIKAALLATIFNLKSGMSVLDEQGYPRSRVCLTGGLTKTPELGQVLADVLAMPVDLLAASDEGTAFGAALLAAFRIQKAKGATISWPMFVNSIRGESSEQFSPATEATNAYVEFGRKYGALVDRISRSKCSQKN